MEKNTDPIFSLTITKFFEDWRGNWGLVVAWIWDAIQMHQPILTSPLHFGLGVRTCMVISFLRGLRMYFGLVRCKYSFFTLVSSMLGLLSLGTSLCEMFDPHSLFRMNGSVS